MSVKLCVDTVIEILLRVLIAIPLFDYVVDLFIAHTFNLVIYLYVL